MYIPPQFEEVREGEIISIIDTFPLATLVCCHEGELIANHIPLLRVDEHSYLGHIAKANALHDLFPDGTDALAIFSAENAYISPNWYPTKQQTHRHVPTWNYQAVHLSGRLKFDVSKKAKLRVVGRLTKHFEKRHSGDSEWKLSDAPADFMEQMLDNIIAFEFNVTRIVAKSKLSQNRDSEDYNSVKQIMKKQNKTYLSTSMENIDIND